MARDNQNLRVLISDSVQKELIRSRQQTQTKSFKEVRDHAARLHSALRSGLLCDCSSIHHAHLRLEHRDCTQPPCFQMTFPITSTNPLKTPLTWHEAEIKALGSTLGSSSTADTISAAGRPESVHRQPKYPGLLASKSGQPTTLQQLKDMQRKRVSWAIIPGTQAASILSANPNGSNREAQPEEQPSVNGPKAIENLCFILRTTDRPFRSCLGLMIHEQCQYEVVSISRNPDPCIDSLTLHDLLDRNQCASWAMAFMPPNESNTPHTDFHLTRKARLRLATTLASTALQLHTTPWLESGWNSKCIRFRHGSLDHPYVSKSFPESVNTVTGDTSAEANSAIRNRSIFGLGVLLLELAVGKPLEHCKNATELSLMERYMVASHLVKYLRDEENDGYFQAVQACLFCNFGRKAPEMDLESDSFRRAVYEDVVSPLEREAEGFCPPRQEIKFQAV